MKKSMSLLILICLVVSLVLNIYQYKSIYSYQKKQHQNTEDVKTALDGLINYTNQINFANVGKEQIRGCLSQSERLNTLVKNSSYSNNQDIVDCFNGLDNVFTDMIVNQNQPSSIGEQIKLLLKSTINEDTMEINPNGCKKLSEFVRRTIQIGCKLIHLDTFDFQAEGFLS